jgi:ABC transport system ATP-binding/permease protein
MSTDPASREAGSPGLSGGGAAAPPPGQQLRIQCQGIERLLQAGAVYRIGRDPQADIVLADPRVSWQHAIVEEQAGSWLLQDAGSTNGTFVNRQRVRQVGIAADCSVRLGHPDDGPMLNCSIAETPHAAPAAPVALQAANAAWPGEAIEVGQIPPPPAQRSGWDRGPSAVLKLHVVALLTWRRLVRTGTARRR